MSTENLALIGLDKLQQDSRFAGIDGSRTTVVVIDTGIDLNHPAFGPDLDHNGIADRIVYSYDFNGFLGLNDADASDHNGHGSNVASIIGSQDSRFPGVAPGCDIVVLKVFKDSTSDHPLDLGAVFGHPALEQALQWVVANRATYNIVAVNMSLGHGNFSAADPAQDIGDEVAELVANRCVVVAASGNFFYDFQSIEGVAAPSADPNIWSVGAVWDRNWGQEFGWRGGARDHTTAADQVISFSQRSADLSDIFAPGGEITGANYDGGTVVESGTSQAAPHISGLIADIQQLSLEVSGQLMAVADLYSLMRSSAVDIVDDDPNGLEDNVANTGLHFKRVDAYAWANAALDKLFEGTAASDTLRGTPANDSIHGGIGSDHITGGRGDDSIDGGDGINDTAVYTFARDHYVVERRGSTVSIAGRFSIERAVDGGDTIINVEKIRFSDRTINVSDLPDLSAGTAAGGNASDGGSAPTNGPSGNDSSSPILTGETITGNDTSEHLHGTSGGDILRGNGGDDVLTGYAAQDTFDGGLGSDTVDQSYQPASVSGTVDLAAGTVTFPGFYTEQLISIENVWMGAGNDTVYGDDGPNDLRGGPGDDVLRGGLGNDIIYGDWKYSDQGGRDTAVLSYTFGAGYSVSGSPDALRIIGAEGDDKFYNVEFFQFFGGATITATDLLQAAAQLYGTGTELISVANDGSIEQPGASGASGTQVISADGNYVAFVYLGRDLVSGVPNSGYDLYVRDRVHGMTEKITDGFSYPVAINADGRFIAYSSGGGLFVYDRLLQFTEQLPVLNSSSNLELSADGRYVAFEQYDVSSIWHHDIAIYDREEKTIEIVSRATNGGVPNGTSWYPSISANGQYVAFTSAASDLVENDDNSLADIFVYDTATGLIERAPAGPSESYPSISGDGRYVAFYSNASNLVQGDNNNWGDIFVFDRVNGTTERISPDFWYDGNRFWPDEVPPFISSNGRYVTYAGSVGGWQGGTVESFVYDRLTEITRPVERHDLADGNVVRVLSDISGDGRFVAYWSPDVFDAGGVFVTDMLANSTPIAVDDLITTSADRPWLGNLLANNGIGNDLDFEDDYLSIFAVDGVRSNVGHSVTLRSGANVTINPDGRAVYDPNGRFDNLNVGQFTNDSFTYTISDGHGHTASATVRITVTGTVHGLLITGGSGFLSGTSAEDQIAGGPGNEIIRGGAGYDWLRGGDGLDQLFGEDGSDALFGDGGDDVVSGGAGYNTVDGGVGNDRVAFTGARSQYNVRLLATGEIEVRDQRPESVDGTNVIQNVELFEFLDGAFTAATVLTNAPVLAIQLDDQALEEDQPWNFILPAESFTDIDGDTLSLSAALASGGALPSWLTFTSPTGVFSGTPPANFNGTIIIAVTASDNLLSVSDTFTLTIMPVNDPPTVANAIHDRSVDEDTAWNFQFAADAFLDVDSSLTYTATLEDGSSLPAWLSFTPAERTFSGTPPLNFNGVLDLKVTASDGVLSVSDSFTLSVTPVNDGPTVTGPTSLRPIDEDSGARLITQAELLGNVTDVDGPSLTAIGLAIAIGAGSLVDNGNGTWAYTPAADDDTSVSFNYQITDGVAAPVTHSASLDILPVNDAGAPNDFNGDGNADILWQSDNGQPGIWLMDGLNVIADRAVGFNPGPNWKVIDAGDFNVDGKSDILWQNENGTPGIWTMDGLTRIGGGNIGDFNPGPSWKVIDTGDFNADSKLDILWQNDDGTPGIWIMDGLNRASGANVGFNPGPTWRVKAAGDFNGDAHADILWQNDNGQPGIWLMDGFNVIADRGVGFNPGPSWKVIDAGDFNADGNADILWQNDNGQPGIWLMDGFTVIADRGVGFNPGPSWRIKTASDYNGDGNADILWQSDNGQPGIWLMDGFNVIADRAVGFNPGPTWHIVGQADLIG